MLKASYLVGLLLMMVLTALAPAGQAASSDTVRIVGWLRKASPFSICMVGQTHYLEIGGKVLQLARSRTAPLETYQDQYVEVEGWLEPALEGCPSLINVQSIRPLATGQVIPSTPVLLSPADGGMLNAASMLLDWSDVPEAQVYQVQVGFAQSNVPSILDTVVHTSTLTLPANYVWELSRTYQWRVRAGNGSGWGPWSKASAFEIRLLPRLLVWPPRGR